MEERREGATKTTMRRDPSYDLKKRLNKHTCSICGRWFETYAELEMHKWLAFKQEPIRCLDAYEELRLREAK